MVKKMAVMVPLVALLVSGQTQVDLGRQVRNVLPVAGGGTNASSQAAARANVGTPALVATDFSGADIGEKVNNAFASFPAGVCGTVQIPAGAYTFSTTIYVRTSCTLEGMGRGNDHATTGTKLLYNGPAATAAIVVMETNMTPSYFASVRNLSIFTNAQECPNDGMLEWNAAAGGPNKWQCYDGATFTAPIPHLAGILHGQIDPSALADGTHITIQNVDINGGGQNGDIDQQGGFHFGLYLNGCEECILQGIYAFQNDDGLFVGEASHGCLYNQVTARLNRRAGFHYRGSNIGLCSMCLFESNVWFGHSTADPLKYGSGIRISQASTGEGRDMKFRQTYFEGNRVDVLAADNLRGSIDIEGGSTIRGKFFNSRFVGVSIADASLITARGGSYIVFGGTVTGTPVLEPDPNGNNSRIIFMDDTASTVLRILAPSSGGGYATTYQGPTGGNESVYVRTTGADGAEGVRLENNSTPAPGDSTDSPLLQFKASKWNGATTPFSWYLRAAARTGAGSESVSGLHVMFNGSSPVSDRQFTFREGGIFRSNMVEAKVTNPAATVSSNAGSGASCSVDAGSGDMAGQLTLTTGTSLWGTGDQCTITLTSGFSGWVALTPANATAGAGMSARQVYVTRNANQFAVSFAVLDTSQKTYQFTWHAIGTY
jgi:hypothetical protein